ncbi:hypothetical protein ACIGCM_22480 [Pseudomonas sp. NPDC078700]|uniref:hypothetical protein n=1 Tax=Pseudomonas sp. NPDC078700 TaxID=3364424 RepID=UPI0037C6EB3B
MFHRILFSLSALSLSICTAQAASAETLNTPRLASADNFRDVAGNTTAYTTANNGVMRG